MIQQSTLSSKNRSLDTDLRCLIGIFLGSKYLLTFGVWMSRELYIIHSANPLLINQSFHLVFVEAEAFSGLFCSSFPKTSQVVASFRVGLLFAISPPLNITKTEGLLIDPVEVVRSLTLRSPRPSKVFRSILKLFNF